MARRGRQQKPQSWADVHRADVLQRARQQQYEAGLRMQRERFMRTLVPLETRHNRRVRIRRRIFIILAYRDQRIRADIEFAFGRRGGALIIWLDMHGVIRFTEQQF